MRMRQKFLSILILFTSGIFMGCNNDRESLSESVERENIFLSEQEANHDSENIVQWNETLYQKYEEYLLNNDELREPYFIAGRKWKDIENSYCELWGESFFGQLGTKGEVGTRGDIFHAGDWKREGRICRNM